MTRPAVRSLALITGATGFTGSSLARALADAGEPVRVLVRSAAKARGMLPPAVEIVEGDITDPAAVTRAVSGAGVIYHLVAVYREAKHRDAEYARIHVEATRLLLDAAHAHGVQRFVHCSTVGVHGHIASPPADEEYAYAPGDVYQRTKLEGELLALSYRERGLPVTVARPTAIYGPGDTRLLKLFRMVARRRFVILGRRHRPEHSVWCRRRGRGLQHVPHRHRPGGNRPGGDQGRLAEPRQAARQHHVDDGGDQQRSRPRRPASTSPIRCPPETRSSPPTPPKEAARAGRCCAAT